MLTSEYGGSVTTACTLASASVLMTSRQSPCFTVTVIRRPSEQGGKAATRQPRLLALGRAREARMIGSGGGESCGPRLQMRQCRFPYEFGVGGRDRLRQFHARHPVDA